MARIEYNDSATTADRTREILAKNRNAKTAIVSGAR